MHALTTRGRLIKRSGLFDGVSESSRPLLSVRCRLIKRAHAAVTWCGQGVAPRFDSCGDAFTGVFARFSLLSKLVIDITLFEHSGLRLFGGPFFESRILNTFFLAGIAFALISAWFERIDAGLLHVSVFIPIGYMVRCHVLQLQPFLVKLSYPNFFFLDVHCMLRDRVITPTGQGIRAVVDLHT